MIVALRDSRNRDGADNSCAYDVKRKAAAMRRHIDGVDAAQFIQRLPAQSDFAAHAVGALVQSHDHINFPPHPFRIIRRGAGQGCIEQRPSRHANIDDQWQLPRDCRITHQRAKLPGVRLVKFFKAQFLFLKLQPLNIAFE